MKKSYIIRYHYIDRENVDNQIEELASNIFVAILTATKRKLCGCYYVGMEKIVVSQIKYIER